MTNFGGFKLMVQGDTGGPVECGYIAEGNLPSGIDTYTLSINLADLPVDLSELTPPYTFYLDAVTFELFNGSGIVLHDWWFETSGIPPLRQRARNDGLTTDTRQEKRQLSPSAMTLPDMWWVGKPGVPPDEGSGST